MNAPACTQVGVDDRTGAIQTLRGDAVAAALHELGERLTAANNYIMASLRLLQSERAERLGEALTQLARAGDRVNSLRKPLLEEGP